jgi:hypothetical protein
LFLSLLRWKLYCWVWNSHLRGRPYWSELTDVIKVFILQRAAATGSSGQEHCGIDCRLGLIAGCSFDTYVYMHM